MTITDEHLRHNTVYQNQIYLSNDLHIMYETVHQTKRGRVHVKQLTEQSCLSKANKRDNTHTSYLVPTQLHGGASS